MLSSALGHSRPTTILLKEFGTIASHLDGLVDQADREQREREQRDVEAMDRTIADAAAARAQEAVSAAVTAQQASGLLPGGTVATAVAVAVAPADADGPAPMEDVIDL